MENSTKALIIAGAILITIILISIGIRILAPTSEMSENLKEHNVSVEVQMFNSKITPYLGNKVNGTDVRSLLSYLMVYNDSKSKSQHNVYVNCYSIVEGIDKYTHKIKSGDIQKIYDAISPSQNYNVYITNCTSHNCLGGYYADGTIGCVSIRKS